MASIPPTSDDESGTLGWRSSAFKVAWREFQVKFPAEEACVEALYGMIAPQGIDCRYCGSAETQRDAGIRFLACLSCGKLTWITAGTFFHGIKKLRPVLAAIWFMERGITINSLQLSQLLEVAYATALKIFKRLAIVVESNMGDDVSVVPSKSFTVLMCKRSSETPARRHPASEQEEVDRAVAAGSVSTDGDSCEGSDSDVTVIPEGQEMIYPDCLGTVESDVLAMLSDERVHFEHLIQRLSLPAGNLSAALVTLELAGFVDRQPGDWYVRRRQKREQSGQIRSSLGRDRACVEQTRGIAAAIRFVRTCFHGVSRKYLQSYLSVHWCIADRKRWKAGALLEMCFRHSPIRYVEILAYVSPPLVRMCPDKA